MTPGRAEPAAIAWPAARVPARGTVHGLADLRERPAEERPPSPLEPGDTLPFFSAREQGATVGSEDNFDSAYDALLRALPEERRDRLTQLEKESRGAWFAILRVHGGPALLVGNSLSGAVVPLAAVGFQTTLLDPSPERLRLALCRARRQVGEELRGLVGGDGPTLPFEDAAFELVVLEAGMGEADAGRAPSLAECRRVCRGELLVVADNRFAYKRSSGRYGDFRRTGPADYLRAALHPRDGERTLRGYRRHLAAAGFAPPRAFALYAHRLDFAHVVALDADLPRLPVGPSERRNRLKTAAQRLGLFPLLTPSFALVSARAELADRPMRIERVLRALAERLGEPVPRAEVLTGTRGNTTVVQTARPGAGEEDPRGRWALHVPMYRAHAGALRSHLEFLARIRREHPAVPVPEPLHCGELDGVWLSCERRVPGIAGHHLARDPELGDRLLCQAAEHFASLVARPPRPLTEGELEQEVGRKLEFLLERWTEPETRRALRELVARAREDLLGAEVPRVLCHGDLRAKHVQVDAAGRVLGYLDWGTSTWSELPGYDLLHLLVHDRKQQLGLTEGEAWRLALDGRGLRPGERRALELYRERLGLSREAARGLGWLYPLYVGYAAQSNWPHCRPGWFWQHFGRGIPRLGPRG